MQSFLSWLGYGLCHQLPERSFFGGGVQLPVCARDTGIYLGIVVSFALIAVLHRGSRPREFPAMATWIVLGVMVGAMAVDGVTSYAGLRATTNELRLFTGLAAGFAVSALLTPVLNDQIWRISAPERVLSPAWRLLVWLAALPVVFVLIRWVGHLLGVGYPIVVAAAVLGALSAINLVILGILPPFERHADKLRDLWLVGSLSLVLAFAEVWFSGVLRHSLEALVLRLG